jgi:hypothetical protein
MTLTPDQIKETQAFQESIDEAAGNAENLMNEFEPGSEEYNFFSDCLAKLRAVSDFNWKLRE